MFVVVKNGLIKSHLRAARGQFYQNLQFFAHKACIHLWIILLFVIFTYGLIEFLNYGEKSVIDNIGPLL
jgi:hypothetical protein